MDGKASGHMNSLSLVCWFFAGSCWFQPAEACTGTRGAGTEVQGNVRGSLSSAMPTELNLFTHPVTGFWILPDYKAACEEVCQLSAYNREPQFQKSLGS